MRNPLDQAPSPDLHGAPALIDPSDLRGRAVLDVGCGWGSFLLYALARGANDVTGLEVFDESLRTARRHVPEARLVVGSAVRLPFASESFDVVTMWEVI